ncbi:MAG: hypothetical protein ACK5NT_14710 [Pyrinomonadaceae bacterium]
MRGVDMFFRMLKIAIPFIWLGAVLAISFMEAPLKFTAPGIDLKLGLGIGAIVFHALNKAEIVLMLIYAFAFIKAKPRKNSSRLLFYGLVIILILQTFVLYPMLDERTAAVLAGTAAPYSSTHVFYIVTEVVKVFMLVALGIINLRIEFSAQISQARIDGVKEIKQVQD